MPRLSREHAEQIDKELARRSLKHFVRYMWPVVEPAYPLKWSWYLDAICDHLEAVSRREIKRLVINLPPRHLKTKLISVLWPAWEWLQRPQTRWMTASYKIELAERDASDARDVMRSERYQALNRQRSGEDAGEPVFDFWEEPEPEPTWQPIFKFADDQNAKTRYVNNHKGHRICTSPGSGGTGDGGDIVVVDDPHSVRQADSDTVRKATIEWWFKTMSSRLNDPKTGARVIVMQRLDADDLSAHAIERGYELLCLPTMFEKEHPHPSRTTLGFCDPRIEEGELLSPDHFGADEVEEARIDLGTLGLVAQHQQRPAPGGGTIFQREWFRFYKSLPLKIEEEAQSWDCTFKGKNKKQEIEKQKKRDYVVGDQFARAGANVYLIDETRGQWDFKETLVQAERFVERYPTARAKYFEAKANGPGIISMLQDKIPGLLELEPQGGKVERAEACSPFVEAGNVWLPDPSIAPWINDWLDEVCAFPFGKHDDRVDTLTQILLKWNVTELARNLRRLRNLAKMPTRGLQSPR